MAIHAKSLFVIGNALCRIIVRNRDVLCNVRTLIVKPRFKAIAVLVKSPNSDHSFKCFLRKLNKIHLAANVKINDFVFFNLNLFLSLKIKYFFIGDT